MFLSEILLQKLYVTEDIFDTKRFYNLKDFEIINKKPLAVNWDLNPSTDANGSKDNVSVYISIADLFRPVKTHDKDFSPGPKE